MKTALVLAPHTDDGEFACGATLAKMVKNGVDVHYVAFSSCEESVSEGEDPDILKKEVMEATKVIGIPHENVILFNYKVRHFGEHRQEILDDIIQIKNRISPEIVFAPSTHDIHQDHITVSQECLRAFKKETILGYEVVWNNYSFVNQLFMCLDEEDVQKKLAAIRCYHSQAERNYANEDFLKGLMITHGVQVGVKYAEVFEVPRMVMHGITL